MGISCGFSFKPSFPTPITGMGRCQGGFCGPRVHEILARELGMSPMDILMDENKTFILTGRTKEENKK